MKNKLALAILALIALIVLSLLTHVGFWLICLGVGYIAGFWSCNTLQKLKTKSAVLVEQ